MTFEPPNISTPPQRFSPQPEQEYPLLYLGSGGINTRQGALTLQLGQRANGITVWEEAAGLG